MSAPLSLRHPNYDFFLFCVVHDTVWGLVAVPCKHLVFGLHHLPASLLRSLAFFMNFTYSELFISTKASLWPRPRCTQETCVFLHYRPLGWCLFNANWSRVIWEVYAEECCLIGSKGLHGGPGAESTDSEEKHAQMVNYTVFFWSVRM